MWLYVKEYYLSIVYIKSLIVRTSIYKYLNISIETIIKNPEILKFISGHLKVKSLCKHTVIKLPYLLRYVPDQNKSQQMCDNSIPKNGRTLW